MVLRQAFDGFAGFTFIELVLVVAITAAITASAIVGLSQLQAVFKIRSAGDEIRSQLQYGRELSIANKDQLSYQISLTSGIVVLRSNLGEIARFQSPAGITYSPASFTWGFSPITGQLTGCSLPCQLTLTSIGNTEVVIFQQNGIVN